MATAVGYLSVKHAEVGSWTFDATNLATDDNAVGYQETIIPGTYSIDMDTFVDAIGGAAISIPVDARIDGVSAVLKYDSSEGGNPVPIDIQLRGASGLLGTAKSEAGSAIKVTANLGSSTDVWGAALTPAIINSTDFGMRIEFTQVGGVGPGALCTGYYLIITIHYTLPTSAEAKLNTALLAHATLVGLVVDRIDREKWLPGTATAPTVFPRIVFQRVFTTKEQVVTGALVSRSVRFQIMCYSESSVEATTVAEAVEGALIDAIGTFDDVTLRDDKSRWDPVAELYETMVEADCLEDVWYTP